MPSNTTGMASTPEEKSDTVMKSSVSQDSAHAPSTHSQAMVKETGVAGPEHFPLLDLPDETWVRIGRMAIDEAPKVDTALLEDIFFFDKEYLKHITRQPALTQVCQALRNELLPYYFTTRVQLLIRRGWQIHDVKDYLNTLTKANRKWVEVGIEYWSGNICLRDTVKIMEKQWPEAVFTYKTVTNGVTEDCAAEEATKCVVTFP